MQCPKCNSELITSFISRRGLNPLFKPTLLMTKLYTTNNLVLEHSEGKRLVKIHPQKSDFTTAGPIRSLWCEECRLVVIPEVGKDLKNRMTGLENLVLNFLFFLLFLLLIACFLGVMNRLV